MGRGSTPIGDMRGHLGICILKVWSLLPSSHKLLLSEYILDRIFKSHSIHRYGDPVPATIQGMISILQSLVCGVFGEMSEVVSHR